MPRVVAVFLGLTNAQAKAARMSSITAARIARRARKVRAHLAGVQELVKARQAEAENVALTAPAGRRQEAGQAPWPRH